MKNKKREKSKKKEQKKIAQNLKNLSSRIELYNKLLKIVGVDDLVAKLPNHIRQYIYSVAWPKINIDADQIKDHPDLSVILDNVKYRYENTFVDINQNKLPISEIYGFLGIIDSLKTIFHNSSALVKKITPQKHYIPKVEVSEKTEIECKNTVEISKKILNELNKIWDEIKEDYIEQVAICASKEIIAYYSFDKIGLYPILELKKTEANKTFLSIRINKTNPVEEFLSIEEKNRKIYRCYRHDYFGISDCVLSVDTIENKIPLPVYIQDHAINRLVERIGINPLGYIFDCVARSLDEPKVSGKDGQSYLIDFNYFSNKLGYLVVSIHKNIAVIRTFKFITMTGTPEFYKLKRQLKGSREEFEYWGLDSLSIIGSDLFKDEKIREIFIKCDLGHLLKISDVLYEEPKFEIATEVKRHFKL